MKHKFKNKKKTLFNYDFLNRCGKSRVTRGHNGAGFGVQWFGRCCCHPGESRRSFFGDRFRVLLRKECLVVDLFMTACAVWAVSQPSPEAGRGQPEHNSSITQKISSLNACLSYTPRRRGDGKDQQAWFCMFFKIISLQHRKLFDLLSV